MIEDPLIGRQLANYRVEKVIGRGGMAQVYYGWDIKLARPVAIKVIDARYRGKPMYAERFVREARAIATWRHENIMQIYYADDQDDVYYYVMEYVDGYDLGELLSQYAEEGQLIPQEDVLWLGRAIASALDYAHEKGVIHRDVKPANVIVAHDNRILLADFGLAMNVTQGSLGQVFGSPHYMSPEQAQDSAQVVPQSDLYSLAILLFEMLTGVPPFDDPNPTTLAVKQMTEDPPSPRSINPALNEATDHVLLKALSKIPAERYQSGAALMDALTAALSGASDEAAAATPDQPTLPLAPAPSQIDGGRRPREGMTIAERLALQLKTNPLTPDSMPTEPSNRRGLGLGLLAALLLGLLLGAYALSTRNEAETPTAGPIVVVTTEATATAPPPSPTMTTTRPQPAVVASTHTPTITQTPTATPSPTPTISPTPSRTPQRTPTVLYPDGRLLRLVYDETGFYLLNLSETPVAVRRLSFELLTPAGLPSTYAFAGQQWAAFYDFVDPGNCEVIDIFGADGDLPGACETINATLTRGATSGEVFWLPRAGEVQFRVLWNEGEVARCQLAAQRCDVYLPDTNDA